MYKGGLCFATSDATLPTPNTYPFDKNTFTIDTFNKRTLGIYCFNIYLTFFFIYNISIEIIMTTWNISKLVFFIITKWGGCHGIMCRSLRFTAIILKKCEIDR